MNALNSLILKNLNPENPDFRIDLQDFIAYESTIRTLDVPLKDSIFEKVLELTKEDEVTCFIRNYQVHLTYLADCTTSYRDKFKTPRENELTVKYTWLLGQASDLIVSMLYFLHSYFATYFDQDKEVPYAVREKAKKRLASKIKKISQLGDFVHDNLLQTVLLPAFEFQHDDPENIATFRRIIYLEVLLNEVISILKNEDNIEEALKWKLVYLNFNSLLFFCYMQKEMKDTIHFKGKNSERVHILNWNLKQIRQMGEKPVFALNPQARSISDRLSEWIKEEISYMEKYPIIDNEETSPESSPNGKIKIDSSVPQLGIVIAILVKLGFISEKDRRSLVRAFSIIFQTKQAETISENSLFNKSKVLESGANAWLKDQLFKAIKLLHGGL